MMDAPTEPMSSGPDLVRFDAGAAATPETLLEDMYERHRHALVRWLAARARHPDEAEDFCQEAFLRLYQELRAGRRPDDPAAWLRRVGLNLIISRARRVAVADRHAHVLRVGDLGDPTMRTVLARERFSEVRAAIDQLPTRYRPVVVTAADGLTSAEVAKSFGLNEGTVRTRLHRARRMLRVADETPSLVR
jgi:RNA polymerase sigma-70 factor (ECF subfamily)